MKLMEIGEIHETVLIGENVKLGKNITIHPYVIIEGNTTIKNNVEILPYTHIGGDTEHKTLPSNPNGFVLIEEGSKIFQHCAITMPTMKETYIGKNTFLMGGSHIGHDCKVMDNAIVGGNGMMAGHSILGEGAFLGDTATVHQWSVVGAYTMVGMETPLRHNALPFTIPYGSPATWKNINQIGVERSPIPKNEHKYIKEVLSMNLENINDLESILYRLKDINETQVYLHFKNFAERIKENMAPNISNKGKMVKRKY